MVVMNMTNEQRQALVAYCEQNNIPVGQGTALKDHTSFRIGGPAALLAIPENGQQLGELCALAQDLGVRWTVLGNGSNVLASDDGYDGLVVKTTGMHTVTISHGMVMAEAGITLYRLATEVGAQELTGLEFAQGIPGTLGGAIYMNAGAYEGEMSQVLEAVSAYDVTNRKVLSFTRDQLELGYRTSIFTKHPDWIILGAIFSLEYGEGQEIFAKMGDLAKRRREKQPLDKPSAGSTFKRPEGYFAAKLIDDCGLKGLSVGGAQVSEKHAGFVVNTGDATAADVKELIRRVQSSVLERTGVELEPEIKFLG